MANGNEIEVRGLRELGETLQKLPLELQRKALRPALRDAASIIEEEAKRRAPYREGELRSKIRTTIKVDPGIGGDCYAAVRSGSRKSHLIEFSTAAHKIIGRFKNAVRKLTKPEGKKRRWRNISEDQQRNILASKDKVFGASVQHPGTKARPFLRPAFDAKHREALDKFRTRLRESIISTVKSAAKKLR